jgi:pimeloyl-ACP methyl ester carboxylesterase
MPFVENQGVKIHYEVEGCGSPIMLMHGFSRDSRVWYEYGYVKALSDEHELILLDARGHGASDKPHDPESYDLGVMVSDLVAILDDLDLPSACFFGYSMGGRVGFRIPLYAPDRFSALILGGALYPLRSDQDAEDTTPLVNGLDLAIKESPDNPMPVYVALWEQAIGRPLDSFTRDQFLSNDALALQAAILALRDAVSPSAEEALPRFTMPCLLFVGESDNHYRGFKECVNRMPNASYVSFPGLDHIEVLTRSDLVLPHVKEFLASLDP